MNANHSYGAKMSQDNRVVKWEPKSEGLNRTTKLVLRKLLLGHDAANDEQNVINIITSVNGYVETPLCVLSSCNVRNVKLEMSFNTKVEFKLVSGNGPVYLSGEETREKSQQFLVLTGDSLPQQHYDSIECHCGLNESKHQPDLDATPDQCHTCGISIKNGDCYLRHALKCIVKKPKMQAIQRSTGNENECPCGSNRQSHCLEKGIPFECSSCSLLIYHRICYINHYIRCRLDNNQ